MTLLSYDLRGTPIIGRCIDMVPYSENFDADLVRLRSLPDVRRFMNLDVAPQLESQSSWRRIYESRNNDVMWIIQDKDGLIYGTNRLYDIDLIAATGEKGSQIVDPELSRLLPAALESEYLVIETAFNKLGLNRIFATIHKDNMRVRSMNERFGFQPDSIVNIRGVDFIKYSLEKCDWDPDPYNKILTHWEKRFQV